MANEFVARNGLIAQNNSTVTGSLNVTGGITGSLLGTASYANEALSSSFASTALSSSYSLTATSASHANNAGNSTSSSFATTSSYADQALSSSYATTASHALSAPPGGYDTQIQFNSGSVFGGSEDLVYNYTLSSLTHGLSNTATGQYSHAEGTGNIASGSNSHAEGNSTIAYGESSHTEGSGGQTLAPYSHTEGGATIAGQYFYNNCSGDGANTITIPSLYGDVTSQFNVSSIVIAIDNSTDAYLYTVNSSSFDGTNTFVFTDETVVLSIKLSVSISEVIFPLNADLPLGNASHAEGYGTKTIGDYSHTEGESTQAIGNYSHAEGQLTQTIGSYSHAEGLETTAIGIHSHAEGRGTIASGSWSHAEGFSTTAIGNYSHAEGFSTTALGNYQLVVGQYNTPILDQSAFIIGDGTIGIGNEHNLLVAASGAVTISGSLLVDGSITSTSLTSSLQGTASYATSASRANSIPLAGTGIGEIQFNNGGILDSTNRITIVSNVLNVTSGATLNATGSLLGSASYADSAGKAGEVGSANFGGSPYTASVIFNKQFPNLLYAVTLTGEDDRIYTVSNKQTTGFTINTNSSVLFTGKVNWIAMPYNS